MFVTKKSLFGACLGISLAACSTFSSDEMPVPAQVSPSPYDDTAWELVRWSLADGQMRAIPRHGDGAVPLTLVFARGAGEPQGTLSGFAGCNRYIGVYRYDAQSSLGVEGLASTRMSCAPAVMALEQDYLKGLGAIVSAAPEPQARPRHLVLVLDDGDVLSFARQANATAAEESGKRLIYLDDRQVPCSGVVPQRCYRVRDSLDAPWQLFYGEIEGFVYQPGTSYLLRVHEIQVDTPPADASAVRWVLDAVLEQRSVVE